MKFVSLIGLTCACLLLSGCINHANNAKKGAEVVIKVHQDWAENAATLLLQSENFCQSPNEHHLLGLQNSQQLYANIVSRTEGFELMVSRQGLLPLRVYRSPDEIAAMVDDFVAEVRIDPSLTPRDYNPDVNSINALEYLIHAQGHQLLTQPEYCDSLINILKDQQQQAERFYRQVEQNATNQLQQMANRQPEEYYGLILDIIRSQLATTLRWANMPFDDEQQFDVSASLAPWSTNTHFHLVQPMETARILFIIAGPQNILHQKKEHALARSVREGLNDVFAQMVQMADYPDIAINDEQRLQMLNAIADLTLIDQQLRQPEIRLLLETLD